MPQVANRRAEIEQHRLNDLLQGTAEELGVDIHSEMMGRVIVATREMSSYTQV